MLSHFTLKTHWTALAPIKALFFTGVAIIKPDLPIIFLNSLPFPSPCCGPSQGGRDKDGPGMGNGASKLNITSASLETHPQPRRQISFCSLSAVSLSPLSFLFFPYPCFNDSSLRWHAFSPSRRPFLCFTRWLVGCLLSQPSISPFSFSTGSFFFQIYFSKDMRIEEGRGLLTVSIQDCAMTTISLTTFLSQCNKTRLRILLKCWCSLAEWPVWFDRTDSNARLTPKEPLFSTVVSKKASQNIQLIKPKMRSHF